MIDKWEALTLLTEAAEDHGLSHRTLGVLRALLSFLPARLVRPDEAIVFPSNATLSTRLNGMPESTLRRHLAGLVAAGIVSRRDSPNRKRYARRGRAGIAFGFDLAPLARMADALRQAAAEARARREELAALRARLADLRARLITVAGEGELTDAARRALRNKPDAARLAQLGGHIQSALLATVPPESSVSDARNERHIQTEYKTIPDSEEEGKPQPDDPTLETVVSVCTEMRSYFPEPVHGWQDLVTRAEKLAPMMGIDPPVFHDAARRLGAVSAGIAVCCILQDVQRIANPGGYLRHLSRTGASGAATAKGMLAALKSRRLSADNPQNACLSEG